MDKSLPPHDEAAEQSVLGAAMIENSFIISAGLTPEHFFFERHRALWTKMQEFYDADRPVDLVTLSPSFPGQSQFIAQLCSGVHTTANVGYHAEIIKEMFLRREILRAAQRVVGSIHKASPEELMGMFDVQAALEGAKHRTMAQVASKSVDLIDRAMDRQKPLLGYSTGFRALDKLTEGIVRKEQIILAGRPGTGKSTLASLIALHVAQGLKAAGSGEFVHVMSAEMSNEAQFLRLLSAETGTHKNRMLKGGLSAHEYEFVHGTAMEMADLPISWDDTVFDFNDVKRSLFVAKKNGAVLAILDYLQLINNSEGGRSDEKRAGYISKTLKMLAKRLDMALLVLSQLNRKVEERENKRPMMSDLRDSGQIEQDADMILFLYHDEKKQKQAVADIVVEREVLPVEIIMAKGRNVGVGHCVLNFEPTLTRFSDVEG